MHKNEIALPNPLKFLDNGIAQVALVVEDLDRTVENYWNYFGIGPWHFYTYCRPLVKDMSYYGEAADYKMRIALSHIGPTRIELIEVVEGETVYQDHIEKHGYGVQHFGFLVDDINEAIVKAKGEGIRVLVDGSGFGPDGDGHYAYLDTEELLGVTLELISRPKRRHPPEKVFPPEDQ